MSAILPLEGAFRNVHKFIKNFERKYCQLEIEEATRVDIFLYDDYPLQKLFKKISHRALITIRVELLLITEGENGVDSVEKNMSCNCRNRLIYNLPCRHSLAALQDRYVEVKDVPRRWRMISEANLDERVTSVTMIPIQVKKPEPWMKYVTLLEPAFRACYGDSNKMKKIMNGNEDVLSKVPELKHTLNKNPEYVVTHSYHRDIMLPKAEDVKAPRRPRKVKRFTSLKKDFSKASSVRYMLFTVSESKPKKY